MQNIDAKRHELVIQATRIGLWDWNIKTGEFHINDRWAEIIGYTIEELKPLSVNICFDHSHPDDIKDVEKLLNEHFAGKTEYYTLKFRMKHKKGHWIWVLDQGKVFDWDEDGKPLRMFGSHLDIDKEKQLEINLKSAINERDILLKEVHHRVKNNLQLLLSLTKLKKTDDSISASEMENSIMSIASAYEAIYKSDKINKLSIKTYFNQVIKPAIAGNDIEFVLDSVEFDSNIDFLVPLGLIVSELITNSIKYAFVDFKDERKKIELKNQLENDELTIVYKDNGKGFDDDTLRLDQNANSATFGVLIMQSLVQQLKGTIKFYNNGGACTEISLPMT